MPFFQNPSEKALEARARRTANRAGLVARKARGAMSLDNLGDFMLVDPQHNGVVAGSRFDMTAVEVIAWCREAENA